MIVYFVLSNLSQIITEKSVQNDSGTCVEKSGKSGTDSEAHGAK